MDLTSVKIIKELLAKYNTWTSKIMGQNFLIDKNVLQKIIKTADLKPDDIVLEVGPGIGTLTQELAKTADKVIAIEKDKKMYEILKEILVEKSAIADFSTKIKNIEIILGDILKLNLMPYTLNPYKVVANIPYYLTSPLIRVFLESKYPPKEIVLMVQKEVAQRICSKPPDMNLLAVSVQFYAEPKIISYVSKNCFWPSPKVDSAIIKITPSLHNGRSSIMQRRGGEDRVDVDLFFRIVKTGFSQPRKQLVNNLATLKSQNGVKLTKEQTAFWLLKNNLKPEQRAETLSVKDWIHLVKYFLKNNFLKNKF